MTTSPALYKITILLQRLHHTIFYGLLPSVYACHHFNGKREDSQLTLSAVHHNLQQKAAFDNHIWRTGNSLVCQAHCFSHSTHFLQPFPMTDSAEVKLMH